MKPQSILVPLFFVLVLLLTIITVQSKCSRGCDRALASYYIWPGSNLSFIARTMKSSLVDPADISYKTMFDYNNQISNVDTTLVGLRINFPFPCDCINGEFLGHVFQYEVNGGESYATIASIYYANLTTVDSLQNTNSYPANNIPDTGTVNVTVNCSCGDRSVSRDYGLFVTYPLRPEDSLASIASSANLNVDLLASYNPGDELSRGSGLVFIPGRDENDVYPPLESASTGGSAFPLESASTGISGGVIVGISVAAIVVVLFLAALVYFGIYRKRKLKGATLLSTRIHDLAAQNDNEKAAESTIPCANAATILSGITVDKSVEFSYEELARATDNFSIANQIGEGGFGAVYYAELRGEKAAIKKMDMQASREFLAELKVLTHVHHLNLVRLIGYCVEGSLFLVYEFIENGNLSQHLRGSGREPLPWSTRVQIALGSARGLEYIHEHTVPLYIHRDIKSANILIDKNFHAKVADFGLTKLTEAGSASLPTRLVGTFGYMPAEYAQYGDVSPKIDVYAFGVVLYELISAKEAIVKQNGSSAELKGLVALFEEVLNLPDPKEGLHKLVDPKLADNYPLDSVLKMAQLAKVCTQELPQLRPSMRSIVVALMRLSSTTEDWDVGSFYETILSST